MCIAAVGRVVSIGNGDAVVEVSQRQRWASTILCPEVKTGDWVLISAMSIVQRLDPLEIEAMRSVAGVVGANDDQ